MTEPTTPELTFSELVFSDLRRYRDYEQPNWTRVLLRCPFLPGLNASILLRAQQRLFARGHVRLANLLRTVGVIVFSADLVPGMQVGPGLYLPHPMGVVMGGDMRIGAGVTILQGVTAGTRTPGGGADHEFAVVEDGAVLAAHAVLVGGVRVGRNAQVGANSVVLKDVPENAVVLGSPARQIGTREPGAPVEA